MSIRALAASLDPAAFEAHFGAPTSSLDELVAANTVTISKLMEYAPAGTPDPTPGIYDLTMYVMGALLAIAFFTKIRMRPVSAPRCPFRTIRSVGTFPANPACTGA